MIPYIFQITEDLYNTFVKENNLNNIHILNEFQNITGDIVCRMFFGDSYKDIQFDGLPIGLALANLVIDVGLQPS